MLQSGSNRRERERGGGERNSSVSSTRELIWYGARSRDSAVGIATGYGLDDRGVGVRVPAELISGLVETTKSSAHSVENGQVKNMPQCTTFTGLESAVSITFILWRADPLLSGGSVNNSLCLVTAGKPVSNTRAVAREVLGKRVPAASDTHATVEILLGYNSGNGVFCVVRSEMLQAGSIEFRCSVELGKGG
jgi:hypothetical protein